MTNQEKIQYFRQYKSLDRKINQQLEELSLWRARAEKITPSYHDGPKGGGRGDRVQTSVERICQIEQEIDQTIDRLQQLKKEILEVMGTVQDPTLREVLCRKYLSGQTFEQIAVDMHYSYMHICRLHGQALDEIML